MQITGQAVAQTCAICDRTLLTGERAHYELAAGRPAVETIVDTYMAHRENAAEPFLDAYRRLGPTPFKEALYGAA